MKAFLLMPRPEKWYQRNSTSESHDLVMEQMNANCMDGNKSVRLTTHSIFGKETPLMKEDQWSNGSTDRQTIKACYRVAQL